MNATINASKRRRALLKSLAAAGLLQGAGLSGLIGRALANGNDPIAAGMRTIKGTVSVNGQAARIGMLIKTGDSVVTSRDSEAVYVIGQDAFLQRDNSSVIFGDAASGFFRIVTGKLLSVFGKGQKKLHVPTATIGIRGTGCYIEAAAERTYFCLCYGEAEIIPSAAPEQREVVTTTHHDHPLTITAKAAKGSIMVAAPVINHTDAELTLLENLVGRQTPFYGKGYKY
jgi:hypothetical protein